MQLATALALAATVWCAARPALAETRVWLIGGGPTLAESQAQIEANVRWLENLLLDRDLSVRTYFGLGDRPGDDVVYASRATDVPFGAEAHARVFGDPLALRLRYRRHELRALVGSSEKAELAAALREDFARLGANDDLLLVYNGHGGIDRADTRNNYLRLWGGERMTVAELERLLDAAPPETTTRFVMTQCYSGAFQAMIYDDPNERAGFKANRCGFMSESELRLAEGCGLDADQTDLRDYSTYFFAALDGATRAGEPLERSALDRDGDGAVSYREAHFHALVAGRSADLPRSTSEQLLEDWSPWYVRWDSLHDNPASVYWALAEEVAVRNGWSFDSRSLETARREAFAALDASRQHAVGVRHEIEAMREELRREIAAAAPGSAGAGGSSAANEALLEATLESSTRYAELARLQRSLPGLNDEVRERTRALTQVEKVFRLRQLARLEHALERYAAPRVRREYEQLLQCESGTVEPGPR